MEKISRKGFLKVAAAAAMSGVTAGALAACNSASSSGTAAEMPMVRCKPAAGRFPTPREVEDQYGRP